VWNDIAHPWVLAPSAVVCTPFFRAWAILLFGSVRRTVEALRWSFRRDSDSFARGDYVEDKLSEVRLALLLVLSGATVIAMYEAFSRPIAWVGG
jgi:hypothetical protein